MKSHYLNTVVFLGASRIWKCRSPRPWFG